MSLRMFMFSLSPTIKNELNYFLLWSYGNIYGTKLGVNSYGLNIYLRVDSDEINNTPNDVFTAIYFEFITIIRFTSTYSFILIYDTWNY